MFGAVALPARAPLANCRAGRTTRSGGRRPRTNAAGRGTRSTGSQPALGVRARGRMRRSRRAQTRLGSWVPIPPRGDSQRDLVWAPGRFGLASRRSAARLEHRARARPGRPERRRRRLLVDGDRLVPEALVDPPRVARQAAPRRVRGRLRETLRSGSTSTSSAGILRGHGLSPRPDAPSPGGLRAHPGVLVDNSCQPNSSWYTGWGIYRHVWLWLGDLHVPLTASRSRRPTSRRRTLRWACTRASPTRPRPSRSSRWARASSRPGAGRPGPSTCAR